jgi:beta-lactamase regulating signal transducer with metallopeptidase domain
MSGESLWTICWSVFGLLAAEAALVMSIAALIARSVKAAAWRRTVWQGCTLALLGVLALEVSGSARYIVAFATGKNRAAHRPMKASPAAARNDSVFEPLQASVKQSSQPNISLSRDLRLEASVGVPPAAREGARPTPPTPAKTSAETGLPAPSSQVPSPSGAVPSKGVETDPISSHESGRADLPVGLDAQQRVPTGIMAPSKFELEQLTAWLVLSWFCGALVFLAVNTMRRLSFSLLRHRSRTIADQALRKRVEDLAGRMGLRGPIHLFESARLLGPVAAGVVRPAIGLPPRFALEHTAQQQDVMLAHEVAHLAAKDPLWSRLADVLAALLWWHPLVWWTRRQLGAASETAADESSLLVQDGPRVLAECLVALGGRLTRQQPAGGMGVDGAGFRSALGRRVERLLDLPSREWRGPGRIRCLLARTVAPAALVGAVIFCTAWTVPQPSTHGDRMKNPVWNRTVSLYALLAALFSPEPPAGAADTPRAIPVKPAVVEPLSPPPVPPVDPPGPDAVAKLKAKLDSIVIDQITFDSIPLGEVVKFLMQEAAAKDPEKAGVNFLFGQPAEPIRGQLAIDPATGLPTAGAAPEVPDLMATTIRIVPPLKKIRLIDALDAIKRVADQPITYTLEGYAVVFSLDVPRIHNASGVAPLQPSPPPQVVQSYTRSFKLDTNTFFVSVKKLFDLQIDPASENIAMQVRAFIFNRLGAKLNAHDSIVLYNPLTGVLLVRASQEDLDTIRAVIETLGGAAADSDPSLARSKEKSPLPPTKQ